MGAPSKFLKTVSLSPQPKIPHKKSDTPASFVPAHSPTDARQTTAKTFLTSVAPLSAATPCASFSQFLSLLFTLLPPYMPLSLSPLLQLLAPVLLLRRLGLGRREEALHEEHDEEVEVG